MDHMTLKKHLLRQILHHPDGISHDQLVEETAAAAGVPSEEHRTNILEWIDFLVTTGHVRRHGESITAEDAARLEFQNHIEDMMDNHNVTLRKWLLR